MHENELFVVLCSPEALFAQQQRRPRESVNWRERLIVHMSGSPGDSRLANKYFELAFVHLRTGRCGTRVLLRQRSTPLRHVAERTKATHCVHNC